MRDRALIQYPCDSMCAFFKTIFAATDMKIAVAVVYPPGPIPAATTFIDLSPKAPPQLLAVIADQIIHVVGTPAAGSARNFSTSRICDLRRSASFSTLKILQISAPLTVAAAALWRMKFSSSSVAGGSSAFFSSVFGSGAPGRGSPFLLRGFLRPLAVFSSVAPGFSPLNQSLGWLMPSSRLL